MSLSLFFLFFGCLSPSPSMACCMLISRNSTRRQSPAYMLLVCLAIITLSPALHFHSSKHRISPSNACTYSIFVIISIRTLVKKLNGQSFQHLKELDVGKQYWLQLIQSRTVSIQIHHMRKCLDWNVVSYRLAVDPFEPLPL